MNFIQKAVRIGGVLACVAVFVALVVFVDPFSVHYHSADAAAVALTTSTAAQASTTPALPPLDIAAYDAKMLVLANNPAPKPVATSTASTTKNPPAGGSLATSTKPVKKLLWPVQGLPYPLPGALLPFNRIVAYYGNFYSKGMGVLGQYSEDVVIQKLNTEKAAWEAADPSTPVVPAIDYIVTTAQGSPGADGKYRFRMPDSQIDHALELADKVHGIVILDVQVGLSNVQTEVPLLEKYLKMPQVHLALDPEFAMHGGAKPGTVIGTMSATDINFATNYLAKLVQDNKLPPKILIVHRFTLPMVTHYKDITPLPEVQVVMDMDGWGFPAKKINTYNTVVTPEPVQFAGLKLFYKNDLKAPSTRLLSMKEIFNLRPIPSFIQYQ